MRMALNVAGQDVPVGAGARAGWACEPRLQELVTSASPPVPYGRHTCAWNDFYFQSILNYSARNMGCMRLLEAMISTISRDYSNPNLNSYKSQHQFLGHTQHRDYHLFTSSQTYQEKKMEPSRYLGVVLNNHIPLFDTMICCVAQKCFRIHSVVQATLKLLASLYYPPELGDSWYELSHSQHCRMLSWEYQLYGFRDYLYPHFSCGLYLSP